MGRHSAFYIGVATITQGDREEEALDIDGCIKSLFIYLSSSAGFIVLRRHAGKAVALHFDCLGVIALSSE